MNSTKRELYKRIFVITLPIVIQNLIDSAVNSADEFVKWPWVFKNYYSYKWARNITRDVDGSEKK